MMEAEQRLRIVDEAMSWLLTPYVDCGDIKGPQGAVDCAMLLIRVYANVGLIPTDFDPRPYKPDWHMHNNEKLYLAGLEKFAHPVMTPGLGDVAMYRYGRHASHGAIIISDTQMIHAHKTAGKVEMMERRTIVDKLDSYWSLF